MYAVGYEVNHHPPFLLIDFHIIGCKCKLIKFKFCSPFHKVKFCGVPSQAVVKVGVLWVKKGCGTLNCMISNKFESHQCKWI
jgi:hypothetical protein